MTKKIKYYFLSFVIIAAVSFGMLELSMRTISLLSGNGFTLQLHELEPYDPGIEGAYQWHPFMGVIFRPYGSFWGSNPNQEGSAKIIVDKNGFVARDHSLKLEKDANEIRIATIGGSTTANLHLNFDENWPGQLGLQLQQRLTGKKVRVINGGTPGYDTAQNISNLALRVMPFKPDIVVIYHAYNDLKPIRSGVTFLPDYSHFHDTPFGYHEKPLFIIRWLNRSMFYVRMRNKYREFKKQTKKITVSGDKIERLTYIPELAEQTFEQHIRSLIAIARAGGAKVVLSSFATLHNTTLDYQDTKVFSRLSDFKKDELYWLFHFQSGLTLETFFNGINRYNEILRKIADEEKIGWVDNARLIPHRDEFFVSRIHFSRRGASLMGANFVPAVLSLLRE